MDTITIATHDGTFHADEIFALAILKFIYKNIKVVRSRDMKILKEADLRIDVGGKYNFDSGDFDHHMPEGSGTRKNGIPYAACGLVWKHFGEKITKNKAAFNFIEKRIIQSIDAIDCGFSFSEERNDIFHYNISDLIDSFNPSWHIKDPDYEQAFFQAIDIAKLIIENELQQAIGNTEAIKYIHTAIHNAVDPRLLILDKYCPWQDIIINETDFIYIIFPSAANDWRIRAVPVRKNSYQLRKPFPVHWAGKSREELSEITQVTDAFFCHRTRFIAGALSKEGAIKMALLALDY